MSTPLRVKVETQEKRRKALDLRIAGTSYARIAEQLGYHSTGTVHRMVRDALAAIPRESAEQLRTSELERLDVMQRALWGNVARGDVDAIKAALKVCESRRKLLGIDAPTRVSATITSELDSEIEQLVQLLAPTELS